MIKFFFCTIYFIIFIFHLESFSHEESYVWFPLAWTLSFDDKNSDTSELELNNIKISFYNIDKKEHIYKNLYIQEKKTTRQTLNKNKNKITLYSEKLIQLEPGKYEFHGLEIDKINSEKLKNIIYISNPFEKNENKHIEFLILKKSITPIPSISIETTLKLKNSLIQKNSLIDIIEDEFISGKIIYYYLNKVLKNFKFKDFFFNASNGNFPPLQTPGNILKNKNSHYLGLFLDIPCKIKGNLKFVWINKNNNMQYFFLEKIPKKNKKCVNQTFIPQKFYLPNDSWFLQSMTLYTESKIKRIFSTGVLINKEKYTKKYFNLNDSSFYYMNIKERALLKNIEIILKEKNDYSKLYFLGTSEIKKQTDLQKQKEYLKFYFKRNFEISFIKKMFSVKKIYNAYTHEIIKKDRIIGDIKFKVLLVGKKNTKKIFEKPLEEIKIYSTKNILDCLKLQEKINPLVGLNGIIKIRVSKKNMQSLDLSKDEIQFQEKGKSQKEILSCIEKKLQNFLFSTPIKDNFYAKIIFESL